ncbi:MAG: hypothetical protein MJA83_09095, partial [Gammaproteobacteria bacterium]|nr:hypothetical protein [Gammaproteobacteria bacterium]
VAKEEKNSRGSDGIVTYESARLAGAESELAVPLEHNEFDHPLVLNEIRRILFKHMNHPGQQYAGAVSSAADLLCR